jgi:hypothetical protein
LRKECDGLRKQQAELQEELRVQRSDKESAHRAVASLRQQLQAASSGNLVGAVSATEGAGHQKTSELEAAAYGQSVSSRLALPPALPI